MKALGIDPGLAATGFAVIEATSVGGQLHHCGCIRTSPRLSTPARLAVIYTRISEIISQWSPGLVVMEEPFVDMRYPKAALQLAEVRGVISLAAQHMRLNIFQIKPSETRLALTGRGRALRADLEATLRRIFSSGGFKSPHATDAMALALTGLSRMGVFRWP